MATDWVAIYTAPSAVFFWLRDLVRSNIEKLDTEMLYSLCQSLMPWRRELLRKVFCEASDLTEIIDFTVTPVSRQCSPSFGIIFYYVTICLTRPLKL